MENKEFKPYIPAEKVTPEITGTDAKVEVEVYVTNKKADQSFLCLLSVYCFFPL